MLEILTPAFEKIILGIVLAAPVGPVTLEMIRRGLSQGGWSAFTVRLGAAMGNLLCLLGAFFGLSQIARFPWAFHGLGLAGSAFLLYTGIQSLLKRPPAPDQNVPAPTGRAGALGTGFYLSLANPIAIVFWSSIYVASADPSAAASWSNLAWNMLIIVGVLIWGGGVALVLGFARHRLSNNTILWINRVSGLAMIYFGAKSLFSLSCTCWDLLGPQ